MGDESQVLSRIWPAVVRTQIFHRKIGRSEGFLGVEYGGIVRRLRSLARGSARLEPPNSRLCSPFRAFDLPVKNLEPFVSERFRLAVGDGLVAAGFEGEL